MPAPAQATPAIGIDLGTSYSAIAYAESLVGTGAIVPRAIPPRNGTSDSRNHDLLPSCLALTPGQDLVVGSKARRYLRVGAAGVRSAKSWMGDVTKRWTVGPHQFSPVDAAAAILRWLKESAEARLQVPVTKAVIGVPASFDPDQRTATLLAAEQAGLEVRDEQGNLLADCLIDEPVAALISFANAEQQKGLFPRIKTPATVVVFDIGGGTVDVCVGRITQRAQGSGTYDLEHLGLSPHTLLGGDDFDALLEAHLLRDLEQQLGQTLAQFEPKLQRVIRGQVAHWAEQVKIELAEMPAPDAVLEIDEPLEGLAWFAEVTKPDYTAIVERLLGQEMVAASPVRARGTRAEHLIEPIVWALDQAKLQVSAVDYVLLTGGMSQVWLVRERLRAFFGKDPIVMDEPDLCVALGAAIDHYYRVQQPQHRPKGVGAGLLPLDLWMQTVSPTGEQTRSILAKQGTHYPHPADSNQWAEKAYAVAGTRGERQPYVDLPIYFGERPLSHVRFRFSAPQEVGTPLQLWYRVDQGVVSYKAHRTNPQTGAIVEAVQGHSAILRDAQPEERPAKPPAAPPKPPVNIDELLSRIRTARNEAEARTATESLVAAPNNVAAVSPLIQALRESPNVVLRKWAVIGLGRIGATSSGAAEARKAVGTLVAELDNPPDYDRLIVPASFYPKELKGSLVAATRIEAAYALGRIGDTSAIPALMKWMNHPKDGNRLAAMQALGKIGNSLDFVRLAAPYLKPLAHVNLQLQAAWAIGRACSQQRRDRLDPRAFLRGDVDVRKPLLGLATSSPTKEVRLNTVYALGAIGFVRDPSTPSPFGAQKAMIFKDFKKVATHFEQIAYQSGLAVITIAQKWMNGQPLTSQELKLVREIEAIEQGAGDEQAIGQGAGDHREATSVEPVEPLTVEIILPPGHPMLTVIARSSRSSSRGAIPNVTSKLINSLATRATALVDQANSRGPSRGLTPAALSTDTRIAETIVNLGQMLFETLFPRDCQKLLMDAPEGTPLYLKIDPPALPIPWELAHDGTTFLCNKFDLGRVLVDSPSPTSTDERPVRMLLIADPSGTLPGVEKEKAQLLEGASSIDVTVLDKGANEVDCLMELNAGFDIVHFAGHSVFDEHDVTKTGWILELGSAPHSHVVLLAERFGRLRKNPPRLVFSNSCKGGAEGGPAAAGAYVYESDVSGIGKAFIGAGTMAYVGSMFNIHDERSAEFAVQFYKTLFDGAPIGRALRLTRQWAVDKWGISDIIWASYILLGDPGLRLG